MLTILFCAIGLFVGSFLANVVYRLKKGEQFVNGRSKCPHCGHQLTALDLVPVFSWVALKSKCRYCKAKISGEYALVELLTGVLFALSYFALNPNGQIEIAQFFVWLIVLSGLIVLAVYDLKWYLLPDKVLLPLIIPAMILICLAFIDTGSYRVLTGPLIAAVLFGGFFYLLAAVSGGKWMGGGDIKLSFLMGLILGIQKTSVAMLIAFNTAAIVGVYLLVTKKLKRDHQIPFGPFLIAGTIAAYLFGQSIIDWYVELTGLNLIFI
jgi:prepilin signal peptidase PulO-like enzyme (type II secretory pathway)